MDLYGFTIPTNVEQHLALNARRRQVCLTLAFALGRVCSRCKVQNFNLKFLNRPINEAYS